jgi:hypothetical protein
MVMTERDNGEKKGRKLGKWEASGLENKYRDKREGKEKVRGEGGKVELRNKVDEEVAQRNEVG